MPNKTNDQLTIKSNVLNPTFATTVVDENNLVRAINIAGENPLTIKIDGQEIVTLMTLGTHPEALVLGYLRNQRLINHIDDLTNITVDWQRETAQVTSKNGIKNLNDKISKRIITTGCGQGTVFSCTMDEVYNSQLPTNSINKSIIYQLLTNLNHYNQIYKSAGAVHTCALCRDAEVIFSVEDVGRHNAADAIAGLMWLEQTIVDDQLIFYTTGRITSEIVMKVAQMGIAILISRSGVTQMGLELAQDVGILIIARAKGKHFLVFTDSSRLIFD